MSQSKARITALDFTRALAIFGITYVEKMDDERADRVAYEKIMLNPIFLSLFLFSEVKKLRLSQLQW